MKKTVLLFLFAFQMIVYGQIEFSGFFDILYQRAITAESNLGFGYGQFEVDISSAISDYVQIEGALAYNPDDEKIELGAGFIDFHYLGDAEEHPPRGKFLTHSGMLVGQIDVPFGIDYLSIPSPDRALVSTPLLNEMTIDSWNDYGINVYGGNNSFNFAFFSVNGFTAGAAIGGRGGITLISNTEVGLSYAADMTNLSTINASITGFDGQTRISSNVVKFEFQQSDGVYMGEVTGLKHSGYYVQCLSDFESWLNLPVFAVYRYGSWTGEFDEDGNGTDDNQNRLTAGMGYRVNDGTELRMEYVSNQVENEDRENLLTLQAVVSF